MNQTANEARWLGPKLDKGQAARIATIVSILNVITFCAALSILGWMFTGERAQAATIVYEMSNDARLYGMCDERPTRVIVETPEEDNAYYCRMIRDKGVKVIGAEGSITKLCAKAGIAL